MLNKFNSLSKGDKNITSAFGMQCIGLNGLVIYAFKMRTLKHGLLNRAFEYVCKNETEIPVMITSETEKKYRTYKTYKYATTDKKVAADIKKAWNTAAGYVLMYKADQKLGTSNCPKFWVDNLSDDELPF
jgi:hypothetical protein